MSLQVYKRIATPYMPNSVAGATNAPAPPYAPGEIGGAFNDPNTGFSYLRVYLDSGATSATSTGVVRVGQLAFWKNRALNIVTNDPNFNDTGTPAASVNRVAGIFAAAVTAAPGVNQANGTPMQYYCDIIIEGQNVPVLAKAGATNIQQGVQVICDTVANIQSPNFGGVTGLASLTTAPTQQVIGTCKSSNVASIGPAGGLVFVDVTLGFLG